MSDTVHVFPVDDLVVHQVDREEDCVCGPTTQFVDGGQVVVHHSLDGREFAERGEPLPTGGGGAC